MRINELKKILKDERSDFALFYNLDSTKINPNMFYFSGYNGLGALVISKKVAFLMVPEMELQRAKQSMIKRVYVIDKKRFFESIRAVIRRNKIKTKKIAIDNDSFTLNAYKHFKKQFKNVKKKDIFLDCLKLRQIKTNSEIRILRKGFSLADKILKKTIKNFNGFKTESEVAAFLEYETKKIGCGISFNPIVASGSNASMPHYEPKNVKLKKGFCVIDFGIRYKGYCTDITRTIYLGKPNNKEKQIYNFLLNIQKDVISDIKIGGNCGKMYEKCVKGLGKYAKYFTHGLGHGIGVEVHELPNLNPNSKDYVMENMAFTIEPGIYIPKKFGIRIEDTVLMQKKVNVLSKVTKDLLII